MLVVSRCGEWMEGGKYLCVVLHAGCDDGVDLEFALVYCCHFECGEACRRLGLGWWEVLMALGCLCKLMWPERAVALGVNRGGWVDSVLGVVGKCFQSSSWFGAAVLLKADDAGIAVW